MRDGQSRAVEAADARHLGLGIVHETRVDGLLCLEDRIDTLSGNDRLPRVGEDQGRVLPVEDDDVDLVTELAVAIDDVRLRGLVAARQVLLEEFDPYLLTGVALGGWVRERLASRGKSLLDLIVEGGKKLFEGPLAHVRFS